MSDEVNEPLLTLTVPEDEPGSGLTVGQVLYVSFFVFLVIGLCLGFYYTTVRPSNERAEKAKAKSTTFDQEQELARISHQTAIENLQTQLGVNKLVFEESDSPLYTGRAVYEVPGQVCVAPYLWREDSMSGDGYDSYYGPIFSITNTVVFRAQETCEPKLATSASPSG